jgi:recombination associated protein RdgC
LPGVASSFGFVAPFRTDFNTSSDLETNLVVAISESMFLMCLQLEDKILPAQVVKQATDARISEIVIENQQKPTRERQRQLKDDVISGLLPRAFSKLQRVNILVDIERGRIILDTLTAKNIEMVWVAVKRIFPDWKIDWVDANSCIKNMTSWLKTDTPDGFTLQKYVVLRDPQQQSRIIRAQQQDLSHNVIQTLLAEGCQVMQLALDWREQMTFTMTDSCGLRGINFADSLLELGHTDGDTDPAQQFITDSLLLAETLRKLYDSLLDQIQPAEAARMPDEAILA